MSDKAKFIGMIGLSVTISITSIVGLTSAISGKKDPECYFRKSVVSEVDQAGKSVVFTDENGKVWSVLVDNTAEFYPGDKFILTLNDEGTPDPRDDSVVDVF